MHISKQFLIFLTGSGLGAAIDYVLTLAIFYMSELDVTRGLAISMCISSVTVFFFHRWLTFESGSKVPLAAALMKFLALAVFIFVVRAILLWALEGFLPIPIQLAIALAAASIINFLMSKYFIFKS